MTVTVLLPSFGYEVIDQSVILRQPWNYLLQITEHLIAKGYKVRMCLHHAKLQDALTKALVDKGVDVCSSLSPSRGDFVIVPFAVGYYIKLHRKIHSLVSELKCKIYIALTTYVDNLRELMVNFIIVKSSGTGTTISKTLAENVALRILRGKLLGNIAGVITPSYDFIDTLYSLGLNKESNIVEFIPSVSVADCYDANREVEEEDIITYFGPFDEERGAFSLINAYFELVRSRNPHIKLKLLIREDGYPLPTGVIKKMKEQNIIVKTKFDNRKGLFKELCASKLVVLPYRIIPSTIPLSYLEALLLNNPLVVATSIPGFREHVHYYLSKTLPGTYQYRNLAEYIAPLLDSTEYVNHVKVKQLNYARLLKDKIRMQSILLKE